MTLQTNFVYRLWFVIPTVLWPRKRDFRTNLNVPSSFHSVDLKPDWNKFMAESAGRKVLLFLFLTHQRLFDGQH